MKKLRTCFSLVFVLFLFFFAAQACGLDVPNDDAWQNNALDGALRAGGPEVAGVPDFSGCYVGVDMGITTGDFKLIAQSTTANAIVILDSFGRLAPDAFAVGVRAGYGIQYHRFFLAAYLQERYHNLYRNAMMFSTFPPGFHNEQYFSAAIKSAWGVGVKPGVLLSSKTLLFVNAAVMLADFRMSTYYDPYFGGVTFSPIRNSLRKRVLGGEFGVGLEHRLSRHWSLMLRYLYTIFPDVSRRIIETGTDANRRSNNTQYNHIALNNFLAGINYYFNPKIAHHAGDSVRPADSRYFNLVFIGVYGGAIQVRSTSGLALEAGTTNSIFSSLDHAKWSGLGGGELGLGYNLHRFYLGGLVHGEGDYLRGTVYYQNFAPAIPTVNRAFVDVVKARQYFGVAAKVGVLLSAKSLLYTKVGAVWANFSTTTRRSEVNRGFFAASTRRQTKTGTEIGLGLEQYLAKGFSFHIEDIYSLYSTVHFLQSQTSVLATNHRVTHRFKPRFNKIVAGIDYYIPF